MRVYFKNGSRTNIKKSFEFATYYKNGAIRIQKNLRLTTKEDVVTYCKNKILDKKSLIYQQGKNWYCKIDQIIITIHASSYTIITAHIVK